MSTIIKLRCVDQVLAFETTPLIASGGQQEDFIQVSFCPLWDGTVKTAVFWRTEDDVYHVPLDETGACVIPPEVLTDEGAFFFGVFGVYANGKQRTTEALRYNVAKGAITVGTKPSDPTPDLYTSVMAMAQQMVAAAEDMRQIMDEYDPPERGKDYWTPEDKAEIIEEVTNELTDQVMEGIADKVVDQVSDEIKDQIEEDLVQDGIGFVVKNVWLATQHTPASAEVVLGSESLQNFYGQPVDDAFNGAPVYRTKALIANEGTLIPENLEQCLVHGDSDALAGYYWATSAASFDTFTNVFYTAEGETTQIYEDEWEEGAPESWRHVCVNARPVSISTIGAKTGTTVVLYGDPGRYPMAGFAEDPAAAPYKGFIFQGCGPFKNLPAWVGTGGGDITVVAPDTVLFIRQKLTEAQKAQARENIGAAAPGEGGGSGGGSYVLTDEDKAEIVAAVLAALPIAEEAEF